MSAAILVRPCLPGDLPAVAAIYGREVLTGTATFELEPPDLAELARRRDVLLAGGHPYLVAEREGLVVGYAYAGTYRTRPAYRGTVENSVYIHHDARRLGVGHRLLAALVEEATGRGFRQMIAVIGDSANTASVRLHAAHGFAHVGVLRSVGWKHGRWLDTVLMQRPLGPGDSTGLEPTRRPGP